MEAYYRVNNLNWKFRMSMFSGACFQCAQHNTRTTGWLQYRQTMVRY